MKELSPEARTILEAGRDGDRPTRADRARVRKALSRTLAAGALGATSAAASKAAGQSAGLAAAKGGPVAGLAAKVIAGAALLGVAGAAVWLPWQANRDRSGQHELVPSQPAAAHTPAVDDRAAPPQPPGEATTGNLTAIPLPPPEPIRIPAPPREPAAPRAGQATPRPAAGNPDTLAGSHSPPPSTLEAETRLLREAHNALQAGQPDRALDLLDQQSQAYAGGQLGEERAAARVLALCEAGRTAEAHALSARFLAEHPQSPLADRVRRACSADPPAPPVP